MWKRISLGALAAAAIAAVPVLDAAAGDRSAARSATARYDCPPLTGSVNGRDPRGVDPRSPNPLQGLRFFVDPEEPSMSDYRRYQRRGQKGKAALISRLAFQPKFKWAGRFTKRGAIRKILGRAQCSQPGTVPQFTILRHQGKACNKRYTAGGAREDARARAWYRAFAEQVGNARVVIAFEPDSIGTLECLAKRRRKARLDLLRYGVDVLSRLPNATIYLEATASDWESPKRTAFHLRYIGVRKVRGFMLNVTHYDWTANNIAYGRKVSRRVGGKPFVVSTSYNGRGPVHYRQWISRSRHLWRRINVYCNPRFRGLGPAPTTNTGDPKVDAFLWINRPGVSGAGGCNGGPAKAGTWWSARALMFSKYATNWRRPPRGTRYGVKARVSLCQLGAPLGGRYSRRAPERRCRR
jgi:endoglucanase